MDTLQIDANVNIFIPLMPDSLVGESSRLFSLPTSGNVPNKFFGIRDLLYLKTGMRDFGAIENNRRMRDAQNIPRDYGIERNLRSG